MKKIFTALTAILLILAICTASLAQDYDNTSYSKYTKKQIIDQLPSDFTVTFRPNAADKAYNTAFAMVASTAIADCKEYYLQKIADLKEDFQRQIDEILGSNMSKEEKERQLNNAAIKAKEALIGELQVALARAQQEAKDVRETNTALGDMNEFLKGQVEELLDMLRENAAANNNAAPTTVNTANNIVINNIIDSGLIPGAAPATESDDSFGTYFKVLTELNELGLKNIGGIASLWNSGAAQIKNIRKMLGIDSLDDFYGYWNFMAIKVVRNMGLLTGDIGDADYDPDEDFFDPDAETEPEDEGETAETTADGSEKPEMIYGDPSTNKDILMEIPGVTDEAFGLDTITKVLFEVTKFGIDNFDGIKKIWDTATDPLGAVKKLTGIDKLSDFKKYWDTIYPIAKDAWPIVKTVFGLNGAPEGETATATETPEQENKDATTEVSEETEAKGEEPGKITGEPEQDNKDVIEEKPEEKGEEPEEKGEEPENKGEEPENKGEEPENKGEEPENKGEEPEKKTTEEEPPRKTTGEEDEEPPRKTTGEEDEEPPRKTTGEEDEEPEKKATEPEKTGEPSQIINNYTININTVDNSTTNTQNISEVKTEDKAEEKPAETEKKVEAPTAEKKLSKKAAKLVNAAKSAEKKAAAKLSSAEKAAEKAKAAAEKAAASGTKSAKKAAEKAKKAANKIKKEANKAKKAAEKATKKAAKYLNN